MISDHSGYVSWGNFPWKFCTIYRMQKCGPPNEKIKQAILFFVGHNRKKNDAGEGKPKLQFNLQHIQYGKCFAIIGCPQVTRVVASRVGGEAPCSAPEPLSGPRPLLLHSPRASPSYLPLLSHPRLFWFSFLRVLGC